MKKKKYKDVKPEFQLWKTTLEDPITSIEKLQLMSSPTFTVKLHRIMADFLL